MLTTDIAILKINGEKLLQIQDDGQFIQSVRSSHNVCHGFAPLTTVMAA